MIPFICLFLLVGCTPENDFELESYNLPEHASLEVAEIFRISSPAEGAFFSAIRKIHILSDGNLVVQNYPDYQLYELTPDGGYVNVVGRQGRGPGEFVETFISHLADGDSLHVYDFNNARHQVLVKNREGEWNHYRERMFRRVISDEMVEQIPQELITAQPGDSYGIFKVFPGSRDTLNANYYYVAQVDENIEHTGEAERIRVANELAIHRGENNSRSVHANRRFFRSFYQYDPGKNDVIMVRNTSNEIIVIDSSDNESVIGYLPYERFPIDREKLQESLVNVNYYYSGMEEIVREKLPDHEPYYWNVILHEGRLWVNLARSDSESPNWIITNLEGEVQESFRGPEEISEVTIHEDRLYGSVRDSDGAVFLVGYELKEM